MFGAALNSTRALALFTLASSGVAVSYAAVSASRLSSIGWLAGAIVFSLLLVFPVVAAYRGYSPAAISLIQVVGGALGLLYVFSVPGPHFVVVLVAAAAVVTNRFAVRVSLHLRGQHAAGDPVGGGNELPRVTRTWVLFIGTLVAVLLMVVVPFALFTPGRGSLVLVLNALSLTLWLGSLALAGAVSRVLTARAEFFGRDAASWTAASSVVLRRQPGELSDRDAERASLWAARDARLMPLVIAAFAAVILAVLLQQVAELTVMDPDRAGLAVVILSVLVIGGAIGVIKLAVRTARLRQYARAHPLAVDLNVAV